MTTETTKNNGHADYTNNVGNIFEIIATTSQRLTGVFDASLNRMQAQVIANDGFSVKPGTVGDKEGALFDILVTVEQEQTGVFRASLARQTAKELAEAGCSL